jgi:hypothetical protein
MKNILIPIFAIMLLVSGCSLVEEPKLTGNKINSNVQGKYTYKGLYSIDSKYSSQTAYYYYGLNEVVIKKKPYVLKFQSYDNNILESYAKFETYKIEYYDSYKKPTSTIYAFTTTKLNFVYSYEESSKTAYESGNVVFLEKEIIDDRKSKNSIRTETWNDYVKDANSEFNLNGDNKTYVRNDTLFRAAGSNSLAIYIKQK